MNLHKMMKQAQEMQTKIASLQEKVEAEEMSGTAGGGMVSLRINGKHDLLKVNIDDSLMKLEEKEMLEDLIVAAFRDAKEKMDSYSSSQMSAVTSGLNLPPGMKLPF
ncbi:MAG: YbaB/EbfC family nucleoid-associated protein [Rickettsiales bacterium]